MFDLPENYLEIRGGLVHCHALIDDDGVVLLDGGFLSNAVGRIEKALSQTDRDFSDVKAIVLSHGHIDHTLNIARLKSLTGAPVFAPRGEEGHIDGTYPYSGISKICGLMESLARRVLRYEVPEVDHWIEDGETLDFWGGLEVMKLPGHTMNHCGFYSASKQILFASDLFANFYHHPKPPPPWLNVRADLVKESILRADALDLSGGVILNHGNRLGPQGHRADLGAIARRLR